MFDPYKKTQTLMLVLACFVPVLVLLFLLRTFISPPKDFPAPYRLTVEKGQTLFSISEELYEAHVIKSKRLFEIFMITLGSEKKVSHGEYYFEAPLSSVEIAIRMSGREFGINRKKVTFPEGFTIREMAERLAVTFPNFDTAFFISLAQGREGYLFPDTYTFFPSSTPEVIITTLSDNFSRQVEPLAEDIKNSGRSLKQIITMASIIEREASGDGDMDMISGILWKRFDHGMALQVDAPFLYILDKKSNELTSKDLQTKSPYNTYLNKGLTPTPIGNPGLDSIKAAIFPKDSPYLYYLHDKNGTIHYAKTYTEHKQNINNYLR
jgi:UPF0755 protein